MNQEIKDLLKKCDDLSDTVNQQLKEINDLKKRLFENDLENAELIKRLKDFKKRD